MPSDDEAESPTNLNHTKEGIANKSRNSDEPLNKNEFCDVIDEIKDDTLSELTDSVSKPEALSFDCNTDGLDGTNSLETKHGEDLDQNNSFDEEKSHDLNIISEGQQVKISHDDADESFYSTTDGGQELPKGHDLHEDHNLNGSLRNGSQNAESSGGQETDHYVREHESANELDDICTSNIDTTGSGRSSESLTERIIRIGNSISPPQQVINHSKSELISKSSSLSNLVRGIPDEGYRERALYISSSLTDLHKRDRQSFTTNPTILNRQIDASSLASDDFDAYDQVKHEAESLDGSLIESEVSTSSPGVLQLQKQVKKLEYDLDVANGSIKHVYDESIKRIHEVSKGYEDKIDHINKKFIECIQENSSLKGSLNECMDARKKLQSNKETLIKNLSTQTDENERLRAKLHMSTDDCFKLKRELDQKCYEVAEMKKFIKKLQDDLSSAAIKVQWANSKLKSEYDAHQTTRSKLSGMEAKIREAKEEADMIRSNCQAMIDKYQNSEDIQSNALGTKLENLEAEFEKLTKSHNTMQSNYENKCIEFEGLEIKLQQITDQLFEKEADYRRAMQESKSQESQKLQLENKLEDLDEKLNSYGNLKSELKNAYMNNQELDSQLKSMKDKVETIESSNSVMNNKEKENNDYFQKITAKNADLQLQVNSLKQGCESQKLRLTSITSELNEVNHKYKEVSEKYALQVGGSSATISDLEVRIEELETSEADLQSQVRDLKNDAVVLRRKNQSDSKDLLRQIDQFRKQFDRQEESMRRVDSVASLDGDRKNRSGTSSEADDSASVSNDSGATVSMENARVMLIERLCSLQKTLAKRQEKIEFYEGHISTLTRDVQKKSRIMQSLLLRVETGERTKLASDAYKKSAPGAPSNNGMTLKLSMEINEKLQQVLEDTLFKNITLKDNIKTLGGEIDRLNAVSNR